MCGLVWAVANIVGTVVVKFKGSRSVKKVPAAAILMQACPEEGQHS